MTWHNLTFVIALLIMLVFMFWAIIPPVFAPYNPKEMFEPWDIMSAGHIFGTNDMGYDIFSELVHATAATLFTGIAAALILLFAGTGIGILAGYLTGWKAEFVNGIIEVFLLIPMLPMTIVLAAFLGPGTSNIILTISILGWCSTAKAVRAKTMQLKHSTFVEALQGLGLSNYRIMWKHILPNLTDVVLAKYIMSVANCMLLEASISFMGLGDPTRITWGGMINFAFKRGGLVRGAVNWFIPPGVCITLCVVVFYCISNYFKDRMDRVTVSEQSYLD